MTTHSSRRTARRIAWTAISLATASLLSVNAQADNDPYSVPRKAVDYTDLDLSVPADANRLYKRLQNAVKSVCGTSTTLDLSKIRKYRHCYQKSLADAVATVNHNSVTALYKADKSVKLADRRKDSAPRS